MNLIGKTIHIHPALGFGKKSTLMLCLSLLGAALFLSPNIGFSQVNAGYDKGFFIQSDDEKSFLFKVGGYVQGQANATAVEAGPDTTNIRVRRARFKFQGHAYSKKFRFMVEYEFRNATLFSTYAEYKHSTEFAVRIGQYRVPFNFEGATSNSTLQFVNRSLAHAYFGIGNEREPGFGLLGKLFDKKLEYTVGAFTGDGINNANANTDVRLAGRLAWNILGHHGTKYADINISEKPQLVYAVGGMRNNLTTGKVYDFTTDLSLKYQGIGAQASYFYKKTDPPAGATLDDHGIMAIIGYMILERVELAGRGTHIWVDGGNNLGEYTAAINYYIYGNHMVKFIVDYSILTTQDGVAVGNDQVNHRGRAQLQVKF